MYFHVCFRKYLILSSLGMIALDFKQEDRFVLLHTFACWQYNFSPKMLSWNILISEKLTKYKNMQSDVMMCHKNCKQYNFEKINAKIEQPPCLIYQFDVLTQPNPFLLRINAKTNFCFAVTHRVLHIKAGPTKFYISNFISTNKRLAKC